MRRRIGDLRPADDAVPPVEGLKDLPPIHKSHPQTTPPETVERICFRERHVESAAPGELLSADTFFVGALEGVGRVYLHAVVDTFGSYAFGFLHVSKQPEAAVAVPRVGDRLGDLLFQMA